MSLDREKRAHAALLAECSGYAAFVAEEQEMDADLGLVIHFADWLLSPGTSAEDHADWTADDFRAEWDHWNS